MDRWDDSSRPGRRQKQFWTELLVRSHERTTIFANIAPRPGTWLETRTGHPGTRYMYLLRNTSVQVVLWIDRGKGSDTANKQFFDELHARREEIERVFGGPLKWDRGPDSRRTTHIRYTITRGGLHMEEHWPEIMERMIDAMIRLDAALRDHLSELWRKEQRGSSTSTLDREQA